MKKSKLSLGLVSAFVATLALSGCSSTVSAKENSLVTFKGHNGEVLDIVTDEMYKDYLKGVNGIADFYDKVLEVLIRYEFEHGKTATPDKSYDTIKQEAQNNVKAQKNTAKENAKTNDTDYDSEWETILDNYGVEDEKELLEHFIYQIEQTQLEDWYLEKNEEKLVKEFIGINETGNVGAAYKDSETYDELVSRLPYHIRHILVKIDTDGNNYTTGTITEDHALKLYNIVHLLKTGLNTFGSIAHTESDDTSKAEYGDVGIMTNKASSDGTLQMFPEFQLGIYAYDALIKNKDKNFTGVDAAKGLGLSSEVKAFVGGNSLTDSAFTAIPGLTEVPYSVFEDLYEVAEIEVDQAGYKVSEHDAVLPRNILYNKYLNHRNPFVITNASRETYSDLDVTDFDTTENKVNPNTINKTNRDTITEKEPGTCGFMKAKDLGLATDDETMVLTDENDNVIIGLRSSSGGVHFIVVQKSIFDVNDGQGANVSLAQYYTTAVPGSADYPKNGDVEKSTYVNFINSRGDKSVYETRANTVKDAIKSFDTTYKYRLYEWLMDQYGSRVTFNDKFNLDTEIAEYVAAQREQNEVNQEDGMKLAWEKYMELIDAQNEARLTKDANGVYTRVIPEGCVIGFKQKLETLKTTNPELYEAYQKGGMCYYGE